MPGIVFDAIAITQFMQHFDVVQRALLEALCLDQAIMAAQPGQALLQLLAD